MDAQDLHTYLETAVTAARSAGAVLQDWRRRFVVREKGRFDLVTDADLAAQGAVREIIERRYPEHAFLGEEGGVHRPPQSMDQPTWIVDPLDGTTNYVHGVPFYTVSIGLQMAGQVQVGVIYDPSQDELFSARRGGGAWLGTERLQTSAIATLEGALLATGFPANLLGREDILEAWKYFSLRTQGMRRTGSSALNLAYVAAGRFDGFFAHQLASWDVAAGTLLVEEAGGRVSQRDGTPYPVSAETPMISSNGPLHEALVKGFQELP